MVIRKSEKMPVPGKGSIRLKPVVMERRMTEREKISTLRAYICGQLPIPSSYFLVRMSKAIQKQQMKKASGESCTYFMLRRVAQSLQQTERLLHALRNAGLHEVLVLVADALFAFRSDEQLRCVFIGLWF